MLLDKEDLAIYESRLWHISDSGYAVWRGVENGVKQTVRLHRLINKTPEGLVTDHINRDKLDNRRSNLRTCTQKENIHNSSIYDNAKGYYYDNTQNRWIIDFKRIGVRSVVVDSEQDARKYIALTLAGDTPQRKFTRRMSLGGRKLSDKDLRYIHDEYANGKTMANIAKELGVARSTVGRVLSGKTFSWHGGRRSKRGKAKKGEQ